ncbi:MAG: hypothetical protein LKJ83_02190 [Eubacteriaceae bacterium]|jgi:shikimate kinase|nr:hypothetical protein [Eubacteriaceae bacterium]
MNYYITGFIGSNRIGCAKQLAAEKGLKFLDMNDEIRVRDGRTVMRIVMSMGEHELHNKEYELLQWLDSPEAAAAAPQGFAVACGDGTLFDGDCRDLMEKGTIVIADPNASPDELWAAASADENIPYAFMMPHGTGEDGNVLRGTDAREKFTKLFLTRKALYDRYK